MSRKFSKAERLLWILVAVIPGYLTLPILYWEWLIRELEAGSFPVHADSIGIPFAGFLLVWIVGPVFLVLIGVVLRLKSRGATA